MLETLDACEFSVTENPSPVTESLPQSLTSELGALGEQNLPTEKIQSAA